MNQTLKFSFRNLFLSCVCLLLFACGGNPEIISPDGRTRLSFVTGADGCMAYTVERDGKPLILPSALGLVVQERNLAGGFSVREIVKRSVDETWTQPWGENKILRDCHNEMTAVLKNDDGVLLTLRFRAFDDGVAFRYEWEVPDLDSLTVTDELTEFRFAEDGVSWSIPGNFNTYELLYRELPVSPIKKMYAFEPVPADPESAARNESIIRAEFVDPAAVEPIRADRADRIVGVQGCTWAEYIEDEEQQEYMIFPRLLAVAELAWTPQEKREWCDFKVRMNSHIPLLQQRGLNTFTLSDEVEITTRIRSGNRAVEVTLDCEKYPAEIRYTLDGTPPTPDASLYEAPFTVTDSTVVRAAVCRDGVIRSPERKQLVTLAAEIDNYYPFDVPEIWKEYFD